MGANHCFNCDDRWANRNVLAAPLRYWRPERSLLTRKREQASPERGIAKSRGRGVAEEPQSGER